MKSLTASFVVVSSFCLPALASPTIARYVLDYATTAGVGSLNGFMDLNISDPNATSTVAGGVFPAWFTNLSLTYNDGTTTTTYTKADFDALYWTPNNPGTVNWTSSLLGQFQDINFGTTSSISPVTALAFMMMSNEDETNKYLLTEAAIDVPGPLPLLGAGAAYTWSRRLRRRQIGASKDVSL